jgi:microcin C transport system substrate-binding protein
MHWTRLMLLSTLLVGCGGDPAPQGQAPDNAVVEPQTTRYVDELPVYPSQPLPDGLDWVTNEDDPVFASAQARRGGTYRTWMLSFPLTLRVVGPDSNGSFAAYTRANDLNLVGIHPNTLKYIPVLATHWAFGADGKTVHYRLDPRAKWSDGLPVTADDYLFTIEFMRSEHIVDPWYNNHYTNNIVDVVKHDDHTISIVGATPKPQEELLTEYGLQPTPRQFHKLDPNWVRDYDWRLAPGTGPYQIARIEKGQFIELGRNPDWWGDTNPYLANRFNPETIRVTVIRDMNVAWEYFLRGELDTFPVVMPNFWHEKALGEPFDRGYLHKITFFTDTPQPSQGLWLNTDDPLLADQNVRLGLAHSMNFDLMLRNLLRGDYARLKQHYDGYWDYSNPDIAPREFDLTRAENYFSASGWSQRGPDGIRTRDWQRLAFSIVYSTQEHTPRLVLLREEARKAGVELNLQLLDASAAFKQILEKKHQIAWMGWSFGLTPAFWEHYHSKNAHIPQTNNITNTDVPEIDDLITRYQDATDKQARVDIAWRLQQILHDRGAFIPAYKVPYTREAYWRWMKLPEHYGTRTSDALFSPVVDGLFWIDEEARSATMSARGSGQNYPPVTIMDTTWRVE